MAISTKQGGALATALFLFLAALVVHPPAAQAGPCGSSPGGYLAGGYSGSATGTYGAEGDIKIPSTQPSMCTGAKSFSDAWIMLFAYDNNTPHVTYYYTQIGFGKDYLTEDENNDLSSPRLTSFAQYRKSGGVGWETTIFPAPSLGSTVHYRNAFRSDDSRVHMLAGGTQYSETPYDVTAYWASAWQGQFFNEANHTATATWGSTSDKTVWTELKKKDIADNWSYFGAVTSLNQGPAGWNVDIFSPAAGGKGVRVWTP